MGNAYHVNAKRNTRVLASGQHWSTVTVIVDSDVLVSWCAVPYLTFQFGQCWHCAKVWLLQSWNWIWFWIESHMASARFLSAMELVRRLMECLLVQISKSDGMSSLVLFTNFRFGCYVKSFCSLFLCLGKGSWRFTCKYIARVPSSSDQTDGMRWKNQSIFYSSTQAAASLHASSSHVYGQTDRWNALYKFWICWARANKRQRHDSQVAVSFTHNCL